VTATINAARAKLGSALTMLSDEKWGNRSYSSVNYMADSSDYKAALKAISSAAPAPRSGQAFSAPELLEPKLRAYLANKSPSELTRAAERWLGTAKQLLDQHAAMRHPPVASPSSATGVVP
jgi:hypothetical protein